MWLKFIKDSPENKKGAVCWTDDNFSAQKNINNGYAIRCLNPDGDIFEDSPPEKIIKQLAAEDSVDFLGEEKELKRIHKGLKKDEKEKLKYGAFVGDEHLSIKNKLSKKLEVKPYVDQIR